MTPRDLGRYRTDRLLGSGAFGQVYRAELHGAMGFTKSVAIKVLASDRPGYDPRRLGTFVNEALLGENLHHPNIVAIHEFGQDGDVYYLVMEYIDGLSLREVLSLCAGRGVLLPQDAVCEIGVQVCAGLDHAHRATTRDGRPMQLIHRDLKPANLLLDRTGTIRIGDFGVARAAINPYFTTRAGEVKGTPRYMAPEQVAGEAGLTPALDVYSLGLVLCEAATGEPVFASDALEPLLHKVLTADTAAARSLLARTAPALHPVVERALAGAVADRYPTAAAMGEALREVWLELGGQPRLPTVAEATLPLRPGRRSGSVAAVKTAEVPVVREPDPDAPPWQRFCEAFADQLGEREIVEGPPRSRSTTSRFLLLGLLGLLLISVVGVGITKLVTSPTDAAETSADVAPREAPAEAAPTPAAIEAQATAATQPAGEESAQGDRREEVAAQARTPAEPLPAEPATPPPPPGPGWFKINSRPWSDVWVDGEPMGQTGAPVFEVAAGPHTVRLVRPNGGASHTLDVDVPASATVDLGCWDFERLAPCER